MTVKETKRYIVDRCWEDTYDCDSPYNLVSDVNREFTRVFLTEDLKRRILDAYGGKPIPSFHLRVDCSGLDEDILTISIQFTDNLWKTTEYVNRELEALIVSAVHRYIHDELGYSSTSAAAFIEKLKEEYPSAGRFFIKTE